MRKNNRKEYRFWPPPENRKKESQLSWIRLILSFFCGGDRKSVFFLLFPYFGLDS